MNILEKSRTRTDILTYAPLILLVMCKQYKWCISITTNLIAMISNSASNRKPSMSNIVEICYCGLVCGDYACVCATDRDKLFEK